MNYMNKNHSKFSRRLYFNYLKVVVCTSLVWILFDTIIIYVYFLDCFDTPDCHKVLESDETQPPDPRTRFSDQEFKIKREFPAKRKKFENRFRNGELSTAAGIKEPDASPRNDDNRIGYDQLEGISNAGGHGENGMAVVVPRELQEKSKELFHINQFNVMASNLVSPNRSLPDIRSEECKRKQYPTESLPSTSVIIVFHNEAWSTLVRTLWSVVNRSPRSLLQEIILIDDASDRDFLGKKLEEFMSTLPVPTHLERMGNRSGLVRSRLRGVSVAKGQTVTFLDAHCECTPGWLEPLLYQVHINRTSVISPLIDVITDDSFEYRLVPDLLAGFDWKVTFDWVTPSPMEHKRRQNDRTLPFRTPTMAGGLFTIDRDYFYEIGSYDDQMNIWGGENLEMSFRVWQCGGQILISTCSRVGHVFRAVSPYTFPDGADRTILVNQMRTVEVWLGDHKKFYYKSNPGAKGFPVGDISERMEFKERMKCRDFKWYLENIYPDSPLPVDFFSVGHVRNLKVGRCLHVSTDGSNALTMKNCFFEVDRQVFSYTAQKTLMTLGKLCLTASGLFGSYISLSACSMQPAVEQQWIYYKDTHTLESPHHYKCLSAEVEGATAALSLGPCDGSENLKWILEEFDGQKYAAEVHADHPLA